MIEQSEFLSADEQEKLKDDLTVNSNNAEAIFKRHEEDKDVIKQELLDSLEAEEKNICDAKEQIDLSVRKIAGEKKDPSFVYKRLTLVGQTEIGYEGKYVEVEKLSKDDFESIADEDKKNLFKFLASV